MEEYRLERLLGKGGFGRVFLATTRETGVPVVVKAIPFRDENRLRIAREIKIPRLLSGHKNIATIIKAQRISDTIYIISEYIQGAITLEEWEIPDITLGEGLLTTLNVMHELTEAYLYIHTQGVAHRDVKPQNILIKGNIPIIIDWDLACIDVPNSQYPCEGIVGTPNYLAPEFWRDQEDVNPFLADVYSLGVVFYYLMNNRELPYEASDIPDLRQQILLGNPRQSNSGYPEVDAIIMAMLRSNPMERISLSAVGDALQLLIKSL